MGWGNAPHARDVGTLHRDSAGITDITKVLSGTVRGKHPAQGWLVLSDQMIPGGRKIKNRGGEADHSQSQKGLLLLLLLDQK